MEKVNLTIEQYFILNILNSEDGLILKELADIVDKDKSAVVRHILKLEKNQFIARSTDYNDKRRKNIFITKRGIAELKKAYTIEENINKMLMKKLSEKQVNQFKSKVQLIHQSFTFN